MSFILIIDKLYMKSVLVNELECYNLQDHYRGIAQREKLEKESKRFLGRKISYMQLRYREGSHFLK